MLIEQIITKIYALLSLSTRSLTIAGCLGNLQTMQTGTDASATATETEEASRPLAELQLSTPKTNYAVKEDGSACAQHSERQI